MLLCRVRRECDAVALKDKLYVAGGSDEVSVDVYTPETDTWGTIMPLPRACKRLNLVVLNEALICIACRGPLEGRGGHEGAWEGWQEYDAKAQCWMAHTRPSPLTADFGHTLCRVYDPALTQINHKF